jgi:hypothetical protein
MYKCILIAATVSMMNLVFVGDGIAATCTSHKNRCERHCSLMPNARNLNWCMGDCASRWQACMQSGIWDTGRRNVEDRTGVQKK